MNVLERGLEKGQDFVKEVSELNRAAVSDYVDIQKDSFKNYVEANRNRFAALREVKDISAFVDTQREYYSALQNNVKESVRKQADLAKSSFRSTRDLVRNLVSDTSDMSSETAGEAVNDAVSDTVSEVVEVSVAPEETAAEPTLSPAPTLRSEDIETPAATKSASKKGGNKKSRD